MAIRATCCSRHVEPRRLRSARRFKSPARLKESIAMPDISPHLYRLFFELGLIPALAPTQCYIAWYADV